MGLLPGSLPGPAALLSPSASCLLPRNLASDGSSLPAAQGSPDDSSQAHAISSTGPFATTPGALPAPLSHKSIWLVTQALGDQVPCWNATSASFQKCQWAGETGSPLSLDRTWLQWARQRAQAAVPSVLRSCQQAGHTLLLFEKSFSFQASCLLSLPQGWKLHQLERGPACSRTPSREGLGSQSQEEP